MIEKLEADLQDSYTAQVAQKAHLPCKPLGNHSYTAQVAQKKLKSGELSHKDSYTAQVAQKYACKRHQDHIVHTSQIT